MGDLAGQADAFDGAFPIAPADKADVAFHIAGHCGGSSDEALELAGMLGLDTVLMEDFAAADRAWLEHKAGRCWGSGHRGWPCWQWPAV